MNNNDKHKLTGQLIKTGTHYTAVWLLDGHKHSRVIPTADSKEAKNRFDEIMARVKKHNDIGG